MKKTYLAYQGDWIFPVRKDFVLGPGISIGAKMLYIAIKSFCSEEMKAFPSADKLAYYLGINRNTVYIYAAELEKKGLMKREQMANGGRYSCTLYTLIEGEKNSIPEKRATRKTGMDSIPEKRATRKTVTNTTVPLIREEGVSLNKEEDAVKNPYRLVSDRLIEKFSRLKGVEYLYGPRDAKAVADALKKFTPEKFLELAEGALKQTDEKKFWWCVNRSSSVYGLVAALNEIQAELKRSSKQASRKVLPTEAGPGSNAHFANF